eukprot:Gregarina_sp_Poly_1__10688@NODE_80_length_15637_cov_125_963134_g68_i0_p14_GENE_NODE_80_length_15637_cov_125_963134_g68_i0NODE_80_length_15637_cov_125_963134_g68_i0_p14_ORF_typecomplete_len136_score13_80SPATA48/PF15073_6/0_059_NODE_80_length_15637_cov_125_963134_g68_i032153622
MITPQRLKSASWRLLFISLQVRPIAKVFFVKSKLNSIQKQNGSGALVWQDRTSTSCQASLPRYSGTPPSASCRVGLHNSDSKMAMSHRRLKSVKKCSSFNHQPTKLGHGCTQSNESNSGITEMSLDGNELGTGYM